MKLHRGYSSIIIAIFVLITSLAFQSFQDPDDSLLFSTGHRVSGEFLVFYNSVDDPQRLFGSPITEVLPDPYGKNKRIQYFERVRMEYDPTRPEGQRVSLAKLGLWLYDETQRGLPVPISYNTPLCRHFPANDKYVCYGFLQFYDRYNGKDIFGEPISNVEYVNNHLVQYFENVRLEWRNEMPVNEKVVLTEIGRMDFDLKYDNPKLLKGIPVPNAPTIPNVKVFVARPLLAAGQSQQVDIIVRDQNNQPIPGSDVQLTIMYDDELVNILASRTTDDDGLTQISFPIENILPNQVVDVLVTATTPGSQVCTGRAWFRSWW